MRDKAVRISFHDSILKHAHNDCDTLVVDELGLKNGECRADIAVLNGKMIGYEIKTDKDTLSRLSNQMSAYNEVFDQVYIITGNRYLRKIEQIVPEWWGIYLIKESLDQEYKFRCYRSAKRNKQKACIGIAQLLWKNELIELLAEKFNIFPKSNATKQDLYNILEQKCTPVKLGKIALKRLKSRAEWRTNQKVLL